MSKDNESGHSLPVDGSRFDIRPIRADDEPLLLAMGGKLSEEKLRPPSFGTAAALSRDCLARLGRLDLVQDAGFVADGKDARGAARLLGVSRYFFDPDTGSAELALEVIKPEEGQGLSDRLLKPLIAAARDRGVRRLVTGAQGPMIGIVTRFGFLMTMRMVGSPGTMEVVRDLERGIDLRKYDPKRIGKPDVRALVAAMDEWPGATEDILDFFRRVDSETVVQGLDELFNEPDPRTRSNALESLVLLLGPKALPWIEKCLADEDVNYRCAGCSYLAELDCPEAVPRLLRCLREDPSDWVRYSAVDGLERCGDKSVLPALKHTAENDPGADYEGRPIRERAREAIKRIKKRSR
jgi:hypothetical protein